MKVEKDVKAPLVMQRVYRHGQIMFLPHYHLPGLFVGPDKLARTPLECEALGACADTAMLWPRGEA